MAKTRTRQYVYRDITMVAGIVNEEPQVKTSKNGNSYARFTIGERFGKKDEGYKYKNFRCCAFGDIGNKVLAQVSKDDNIMVIGNVSAIPFTRADGSCGAGLWINVLRYELNPSAKTWEAKEKELEQNTDEEESEDMSNAETLWGIDF